MFTDYNTDYDIPCYYCSLYNEITKDYPINSASKKSIELTREIPRCLFHFQYECTNCNQDKHFNGISWCSDCKQYTCTSCSSVKVIELDFFHYDYYYEIDCINCKKQNPTLDAAEYTLQHLFQTGDLRHDLPINLWIPTTGKYEVSKFKGQNQFVRYESWISQRIDRSITPEEIISQYDSQSETVSEKYLEDDMLIQIVYPAILAEIKELKGKSVLDFGCGVGGLTRQLGDAELVVGLDPSEMINLAEKMEQDHPIGNVYHKTNLSMLKDRFLGKFDIIVSNAVLTEVPDLTKTLKDLFDVMKQNGRLIFTIRHPCLLPPGTWSSMRIPVDSVRNEDLILTKKNYFAEGPYVLSAEGHFLDGAITHHYTLSTYINTLIQLGFTIEKVFEPRSSAELTNSNPTRFKNTQEFHPVFLGVVARKL